MKLYEREEHFFGFRILGYQYPGQEGRFYDRNWLLVDLSYRRDDQSWSIVEPALLVWEAHDLVHFLQNLIEHEPQSYPVVFSTLDQQIEIACVGRSGHRFHITVSNYFVTPPEWLLIAPYSYSNQLLMVDEGRLKKAVRALSCVLKGYPVRPEVLPSIKGTEGLKNNPTVPFIFVPFIFVPFIFAPSPLFSQAKRMATTNYPDHQVSLCFSELHRGLVYSPDFLLYLISDRSDLFRGQ